MVDPLSEREENRLFEDLERSRTVMLEAILSVAQGRRMILQPIEKLLRGSMMETELLDAGYWKISRGVLPQSAIEELEGLLAKLRGTYLNREAVRGMHFLWHAVERIGKELFSDIHIFQKLLRQRNEIAAAVEASGESITSLSTSYDIIDRSIDPYCRMAWRVHDRYHSILNRLDLIEVRTGIDIMGFFKRPCCFIGIGNRSPLYFGHPVNPLVIDQ